ncbi:MAG: TIGR01777 family protein [Candidatus Marinimicrobia bacterium]|nr:TIGR01777 family protein [Candidatus Neomarinimicrobiota bacterium]
MRIAIAGASGFIGTAIAARFKSQGHDIVTIGRKGNMSTDLVWDIETGTLDATALEGLDAVVHLAGENLSRGRWTDRRKRSILQSRTLSTRLLSTTLAHLDRPPAVLLVASAVGYYGSRGSETVDESSSSGAGFLADVCRAWEAAADPARAAGIRVVHARQGMVLGNGGALRLMALPFKLGLGGRIGTGEQYMPWMALADVVAAYEFLIHNEAIEGAVNFVAPEQVTNREFTSALGKAVRRPTILPLPAFMARIIFGEMADELLLASTRVNPKVLVSAGYEFTCPTLIQALEAALK